VSTEHPEGIDPLEPKRLEEQLRTLAGSRPGTGIVDDLELHHLVTVILHGALLLQDLYESDRVDTIYWGEPRSVARSLIAPVLGESDRFESSLLPRVGRLPDQVRLLGDKCLFDVGITGLRKYRGLDLQDLGVRAYRMASEVLGVLAEDRGLRDFFDRNRLGPLPILEEIAFLKQCAERFAIHADLLHNLPRPEGLSGDGAPAVLAPARLRTARPGDTPAPAGLCGRRKSDGADLPDQPAVEGTESAEDPVGGVASRAGRPKGGAESGSKATETGPEGRTRTQPADDAASRMPAEDGTLATGALCAARAEDSVLEGETARMSRDDLLSAYERIVLFAALDVDRLGTRLRETVIDQPAAVDALCDEFALYAAGTHNLTKPPSYFFVGPTGVGKNYLVESLVRTLGETWGMEIPILTIDGPNYTDASDINELRGSTRGFIRSDEEGLLAEFHARSSQSPLSFILVDEVEKAHPHLRKFFLGMMDRGTVTDNRGRTLSFANAMLFFTSNVGYSEAVQRGTPIGYRGDEEKGAFEESEVSRGLRHALSAEFMNRVRVIRFEHLSRASIDRILDLELEKVCRRFRDIHGLELAVTQAARDEILRRGYSHDFGARHLASVINQLANVEVSKILKRDDRDTKRMDNDVLDYLRKIRSKERAFDPRDVRARVLEAARVHVPYRTVTIDFDGRTFRYLK
jgi:MoxR-like ATPase